MVATLAAVVNWAGSTNASADVIAFVAEGASDSKSLFDTFITVSIAVAVHGTSHADTLISFVTVRVSRVAPRAFGTHLWLIFENDGDARVTAHALTDWLIRQRQEFVLAALLNRNVDGGMMVRMSLLRGHQVAVFADLGQDGGRRLRGEFGGLWRNMSVGIRGTLVAADTRTGAIGRVGAVSTASRGLDRIQPG